MVTIAVALVGGALRNAENALRATHDPARYSAGRSANDCADRSGSLVADCGTLRGAADDP